MIVGLSPEKLQAAERTPGADRRVRTLAADVTKEAEIAWLFDEVGAFDRLISTAGTPPRGDPIDRTDTDVLRRFVDKEQECQVGRVARRTRNISAEGEPHARRQVRYAMWGRLRHLIGFIVVVLAIFSFLAFHWEGLCSATTINEARLQSPSLSS
ncbi:hypothetical protein [Mesorhizobium sp. ISC15]|uniref:hypothetical protein n=1 Tax=Mesorhizobium sp. ISC15 TaxID=3076429 RepID=UPI00301C0EF9